jgi:hypothetical protein
MSATIRDMLTQIPSKHEPIDLSTIKTGNLVEIAFACVAVPTKEGRHKMMLNLKAVTIIDDSIRKVSPDVLVTDATRG